MAKKRVAKKSATRKSQRSSANKSLKNPAKKPQKAPGLMKSQTASLVASLVNRVRSEIWPDERQVLFRPERLKYVRKLVKPDGCVFCHAVKAGVSPESLLLYKDDHAIVVMNKYPYNTGHLLVLPRRHCGDFTQLTEEEMVGINRALQTSVRALGEVFKPNGFNVGLNLGSAAGAGIPEHLHYHIVPRWAGDTNFFPLIAETKVVIETLETSFAKLLPFFVSEKDAQKAAVKE
jgi:ATP adenylyltransferase